MWLCFCRAVILFLIEDIQISKLSHRYLEKELWNRQGHMMQHENITFSEADKFFFVWIKQLSLSVQEHSCYPEKVWGGVQQRISWWRQKVFYVSMHSCFIVVNVSEWSWYSEGRVICCRHTAPQGQTQLGQALLFMLSGDWYSSFCV